MRFFINRAAVLHCSGPLYTLVTRIDLYLTVKMYFDRLQVSDSNDVDNQWYQTGPFCI